ncbi:hypothetical protein TWF694_003737 [Orbilia ellipsospora]|uniref:Uncharacterized protein n=1 Tax=Orbilia ellipsospora TaxID=2528407 RepID=A0AAV9WZ44_9PEZI
MKKSILLLYFSPSIFNLSFAALDPYPGNLNDQVGASLQNVRNLQAANPLAQKTPEEIIWAPPGESILITPKQWQDFEKSLGVGTDREGPIWYILVAARRVLQLSHSLTSTVILLQQALAERGEANVEEVLDQFITRFSDLIGPLDNYLYRLPHHRTDYTQNPAAINMKTEGNPQLKEAFAQMLTILEQTPGLLNRGGVLDPGSQGQPSSISTRVTLRRMFDYDVGKTATDTAILLNDAYFLRAWETVYGVMQNLAQFEEQVTETMERLRLKYLPNNAAAYRQPVFDPYPVGLYDRKADGYGNYWLYKYELGTRSPGNDDQLGEMWGNYNVNNSTITDMCASYLIQLDSILRGVLPFMMDMFADIAVKANELANTSEWRKKNWAVIKTPDLAPSIDFLKQYPEWSEDAYSTQAQNWPEFGPLEEQNAVTLDADVF